MKKKIIMLMLGVFYGITGLCQNDALKGRFNGEFERINPHEFGLDSLSRKQGEWNENIESFPVIYGDTSYICDSVNTYGFYKDDKREGIWEITSTMKNHFGTLLAHRYYSKDSLIYTIYFKNYRIKSIVRESRIKRFNNSNYPFYLKIDDITVFNDEGKIIYRNFYAPDGIYENRNYKNLPKYNKKEIQKSKNRKQQKAD
jgi:hypothetical protein